MTFTASSQSGAATAAGTAPSTAARCSGCGRRPWMPTCTSTRRAVSTSRSPSPASSRSNCRAYTRRARTRPSLLPTQRQRRGEEGARRTTASTRRDDAAAALSPPTRNLRCALPPRHATQLARCASAGRQWSSARRTRASLPVASPMHGGGARCARCSGRARSLTCSGTRLPPSPSPPHRHRCMMMAATPQQPRSPPRSPQARPPPTPPPPLLPPPLPRRGRGWRRCCAATAAAWCSRRCSASARCCADSPRTRSRDASSGCTSSRTTPPSCAPTSPRRRSRPRS